MVTLTISLCTNVTLTFVFDFGRDQPVHGDKGEGALHWEDEVTVKQRYSNLVMGPIVARLQDELADRPSVAM
jgi:hypothetical protein